MQKQNGHHLPPTINVKPKVALHDEKISIRLENFPIKEKITLHGDSVQAPKGVIFASCGHYVSDGRGQVRVADQPSTGGTYTGVEPMGIVWSFVHVPGQPSYYMMKIKSSDQPCVIHLKAYRGHLSIEDIYDSQSQPESLADVVTLERWARFPAKVSREEVCAGNLRGALFLPPGDGPFQGLIDIAGGAAGGLIEARAALLASRGFASFTLPFFRYKDLPPRMSDVTLDYFEEAVKWLSSHPKVCSGGIAVVANSKGTEYAYTMSAYFEQVKCVVAICGHPYFRNNDLYYKGERLIEGSEFEVDRCEITEDGDLIIADSMPFKDNMIPSWEGDAQHLLILAEGDQLLTTDNFELLFKSCPEEKRQHYEVVRYPRAGHVLDTPYSPLCRSSRLPVYADDKLVAYGGQIKDHEHAQEDAWQRILIHLRKHIPTS